MTAIAREAGVATGTPYVHYTSKDALIYATYLEIKHDLGEAAAARVDATAPARTRFEELWYGAYDYLHEDRDRARFLIQVDSSPYAETAQQMAMATDADPLMAAAAEPDMIEQLVPLPLPVLYDLAIGPIVRLTASEREPDPAALPTLVEACWRAITR